MRKPRAASESRTYAALLASQNKNIVAMMKIASAFKYGSITDNLDCDKPAFITYEFSSPGRQAEPTEDQGHNINKAANTT